MANDAVPRSSSLSTGHFLGLVLAVVLVGGLVATPLYLRHFQDDATALDAAVRGDMETLRRATENIDAHLEALHDLQRSLAGHTTTDAGFSELVSRNGKLLEQAEGAARSLREARQGSLVSGAHWGANRTLAIFHLSAGMMHGNRAEFQEQQAVAARQDALVKAIAAMPLRRSARAMEDWKGAAGDAELEARADTIHRQIKLLEQALAAYEEQIASQEKKLAAREKEARDARERLSELSPEKTTPGQYEAAYVALSNTARLAEADAAALLNGSLAGAARAFPEPDDLLSATYSGGVVEPGLRDLKIRAGALREQLAAAQQAAEGVVQRQAERKLLEDKLDAEHGEIDRRLRSSQQETDEALAAAAEHSKTAEAARGKAWESLRRAADFAKLAVAAAKQRASRAANELRDLGGARDERLERLSKDTEAEASAQCLAADVAYQQALVCYNRLSARLAQTESDDALAGIMDRPRPEADDNALGALRTEADASLAAAAAALAAAKDKLKGASVKAPDGTTLNGSNCVWQVDLAVAAVHLLQANLAADPSQRAEAQNRADEVLREAIRDREQSPLLTPAVDALQLLQQTAR